MKHLKFIHFYRGIKRLFQYIFIFDVDILKEKGVLSLAKNKAYQPEGYKQYAGLENEKDVDVKGNPTTPHSRNKGKK